MIGAVERRSRRDLNRRERPVVEVGFHPPQGGNDPFVADRKPNAPAGHRIGLRHRSELDGNFHRAGDLEDRGRRIILEIHLRIGKIREHENAVSLRERNELPVKIEVGHIGGRIRRIADHDRDRLRC